MSQLNISLTNFGQPNCVTSCPMVTVPDNKSRNIPKVVLVRRWAVGVLGILEGRGGLGEGRGKWGQFTSNLRPRWTIPLTAGGCQVSKRGHKGETKGN